MTQQFQVEEREFNIDGLRICGREWGSGGRPLLALHGWLDNAASFDALGEWLGEHVGDIHMLAIDLPGHGLSDNKPAHASYQIWDDLLIILAVADAMGWEQFGLLGHSRGAIMSVLLTAACPERVSALICLDGLIPEPVKVEDTAQQLGSYLQDCRRLHERKPRVFKSLDEIVKARVKVMPMGEQAARKISERAAIKTQGGYIWNSDPRLKAASAFKLTQDHLQAILASLDVPVMLVVAESGFGRYPQIKAMTALIKDCHFRQLPGSHHFHMEAAAPEIGTLIQDFVARDC